MRRGARSKHRKMFEHVAPPPRAGSPSGSPTAGFLTLHINHYVLPALLAISSITLYTLPTVVDISSWYNIRKEVLPLGWHGSVVREAPLPNLVDTNENPLPFKHVVQAQLRLHETSFKIPFVEVDSLSYYLVLRTEFLDKNVDDILRRDPS